MTNKYVKHSVIPLLVTGLALSLALPYTDVFAAENVSEENDTPVVNLDTTQPMAAIPEQSGMMLGQNLIVDGGSVYRLASSQIVDLRPYNILSTVLLVGGLNYVTYGSRIASSIANAAGATYGFTNYRYLKQSIYKYTSSKRIYYKVEDAFSQSKTKWSGPKYSYYYDFAK